MRRGCHTYCKSWQGLTRECIFQTNSNTHPQIIKGVLFLARARSGLTHRFTWESWIKQKPHEGFRAEQRWRTAYWWRWERGRGCQSWAKAEIFRYDRRREKYYYFNNFWGPSGSLLVLLQSPSGEERLMFSRVFWVFEKHEAETAGKDASSSCCLFIHALWFLPTVRTRLCFCVLVLVDVWKHLGLCVHTHTQSVQVFQCTTWNHMKIIKHVPYSTRSSVRSKTWSLCDLLFS